MNNELLQILIPAFLSFLGVTMTGICTVIVARVQRKQIIAEEKHDRQRDEDALKEKQRTEIQLAQVSALAATMDLSLITSYAVTGTGKINGNLKEAQRKAAEAQGELESLKGIALVNSTL